LGAEVGLALPLHRLPYRRSLGRRHASWAGSRNAREPSPSHRKPADAPRLRFDGKPSFGPEALLRLVRDHPFPPVAAAAGAVRGAAPVDAARLPRRESDCSSSRTFGPAERSSGRADIPLAPRCDLSDPDRIRTTTPDPGKVPWRPRAGCRLRARFSCGRPSDRFSADTCVLAVISGRRRARSGPCRDGGTPVPPCATREARRVPAHFGT
jgi:hypothetical protein